MIKILSNMFRFSIASTFILLVSHYSYAESSYLCGTAFQWTSTGEFHMNEVVRYKGVAYKQKVDVTKGVQPDTNSANWSPLGACVAETVVSCDFNGDGRMDSAKGFPDVDLVGGVTSKAPLRENEGFEDTGEVSVTYGDKLPNQQANIIWDQNGLGMNPYASRDAKFGSSLAVGDFNHDNFCDLAISAPGYNSNRGMINILYGSPNGLTIFVLGESGRITNPFDAQRFDQNSPNVSGVAEAGDLFGRSLVAGDFNGDGYADLAVGSPYESVESIKAFAAGYVHVLYGSRVGIQTINPKPGAYLQRLSGTQELDAESNDNFGLRLAAADFDKDGYSDLVIPAIGEDDGIGRVTVLRGSPSGLDTKSQRDFNENTLAAGVHSSKFFGNYMSITDFNNDGYPDLWISVYPSPMETKSYKIPGSALGLVIP